jgi:hypothetical protein
LFCRDVPKGSGNIETLIEITNAKHFQAAAMLSTGLFELAVDIRLLDRVPHATEKMIVSVEVEKLRCARKAVAFGTTNLGAKVDTIFESFIREKGSGIDAKHRRLWPNKEQSEKLRIVRHWSGLDLNARVRLLEEPFNRIYVLEYPKMSWYPSRFNWRRKCKYGSVHPHLFERLQTGSRCLLGSSQGRDSEIQD